MPSSASMPLREDRMLAVSRGALVAPRGVCRSLFGPIDHEELRGELKRQLKEIQTKDCQRWNFDFQAGSPLRGSYCWEPQEGREMPSFYRENQAQPPKEESPESLKENEQSTSTTPGGKKSSSARMPVPGGKRRGSAITDFFPKKKRTSGWKVPGEGGSAPHPLLCKEQTPRKKIR